MRLPGLMPEKEQTKHPVKNRQMLLLIGFIHYRHTYEYIYPKLSRF